jgi:hypothetical protein
VLRLTSYDGFQGEGRPGTEHRSIMEFIVAQREVDELIEQRLQTATNTGGSDLRIQRCHRILSWNSIPHTCRV